MNTYIIIFCIIGFLFTYSYSLASQNLRIIKNNVIGKATHIEVLHKLKNNKKYHIYSVTINNITYQIRTNQDFSKVIHENSLVDLLVMQSGRQFLRFHSNKNFIFLILNSKE